MKIKVPAMALAMPFVVVLVYGLDLTFHGFSLFPIPMVLAATSLIVIFKLMQRYPSPKSTVFTLTLLSRKTKKALDEQYEAAHKNCQEGKPCCGSCPVFDAMMCTEECVQPCQNPKHGVRF